MVNLVTVVEWNEVTLGLGTVFTLQGQSYPIYVLLVHCVLAENIWGNFDLVVFSVIFV